MIKRVKDRIKRTIAQHNLIEKGDLVILGLSGGPDSLCLFDVLLGLSKEIGFELHGAHINHMFRPGDADDDQMFVENLCSNNGICCWSKVEDCTSLAKELKITSEEAGRKVRYDFFADIASSLAYEGADPEKIKVAIAHNRDDQAETILFRIIRGTGTDGLAGIDYTNINQRGSKLIRPLLDVPRVDIEDYCEQRQLEPRIDVTNFQTTYGRNKIRLDVIPYLAEHYNPNIKDVLVRMGDIAREDRNYIWTVANQAYGQALVRIDDNEVLLNRQKLIELDSTVRNRVIFKAFGEIGLDSDISHTHILDAEKLILEGVTPQQIDFPKGYVIRVSYDNISFGKDWSLVLKDQEPELKVRVINKSEFDDLNCHNKVSKDNEFGGTADNRPLENCLPRNKSAAFDLDLMEAEFGRKGLEDLVRIRRREPGDYIKLPGMKGRKKIQDLFVDMKVPKYVRNQIYLVALGHEVLWIPRVESLYQFKGRYSGNYKVREDTKNVLTVEIDGVLW